MFKDSSGNGMIDIFNRLIKKLGQNETASKLGLKKARFGHLMSRGNSKQLEILRAVCKARILDKSSWNKLGKELDAVFLKDEKK